MAGSVTIDDGSGSLDVSDVEKDLVIVNNGSGGLGFSDIAGRVDAETSPARRVVLALGHRVS